MAARPARLLPVRDGGRGSPIGGDAPGQEQRCSAAISSEASSRAFRSNPEEDPMADDCDTGH
jgi:hypothetical protein